MAGKKKEKEFRRVKTIPPMAAVVPFIMVNRTGSQNFIRDSFDVEKLEQYIKEKKAEGMTDISMMHVMIAAYVRLVSQRPALNRFIRGQRVWTRKHVEVSLSIKKEMTLESPDTCVKAWLLPNATMREVYDAVNKEIVDYRNDPGGDFDSVAAFITHFPALFFKFFVWAMKTLDYFGLMPKLIAKVSPFHCSYFITSMGSLGIPPIYHHLYDFGTCPVFFAFGAKRRVYEPDAEGKIKRKGYLDFTFVLDERICDGYYYASALRQLKLIVRDPWQLDNPPETVVEDIP
ncbi:MAG: hypothetical protein II953_09355 [Clostridia bacterium]|jgi:hypothetical protein|nr:hypothetical protein [Clostridia bacterium]